MKKDIELFIVATERDSDCPFKSDGAIIMETYTKSATFEEAVARAERDKQAAIDRAEAEKQAAVQAERRVVRVELPVSPPVDAVVDHDVVEVTAREVRQPNLRELNVQQVGVDLAEHGRRVSGAERGRDAFRDDVAVTHVDAVTVLVQVVLDTAAERRRMRRDVLSYECRVELAVSPQEVIQAHGHAASRGCNHSPSVLIGA